MTSATEDIVELHPFAKLAFLALTTRDQKTYFMTDASRVRLIAAFERLFDKPDLRSAVLSLVSLAKHVEDAGNVDAANALISIAATASGALKKQGTRSRELADDLGQMTTATFEAFSDREATVVRAAPVQQTAKHAKHGALTIASMHAAKRKIIR